MVKVSDEVVMLSKVRWEMLKRHSFDNFDGVTMVRGQGMQAFCLYGSRDALNALADAIGEREVDVSELNELKALVKNSKGIVEQQRKR